MYGFNNLQVIAYYFMIIYKSLLWELLSDAYRVACFSVLYIALFKLLNISAT